MVKVYEREGKHCAFTDLAFHKGNYYLCFREGEEHMFSKSRIIVMKSKDGNTWDKIAETKELCDIRDPRFGFSEKGKIRVVINFQYCGKDNKKVLSQSLISWDLKNGYKFIGKNKFITFIKGKKAFSYNPTTNGDNKLIRFGGETKSIPSFNDSTEGAFYSNKKNIIYFVRRDFNQSYFIMQGKGGWLIRPVKEKIHCPYLFSVSRNRYLLGREQGKLCLYKISFQKDFLLNRIHCFKAFGDCGYFGYAKGLVSFYSSYNKKKLEKTAIYVENIKGMIK